MSASTTSFAEQIKRERARLHFTQKDVASLLEVTCAAVEKWESGTAVPPSITQEGALARLAKAEPKTADLSKAV